MKRWALAFDLDGTLVDSLPDLRAALNATLREIGKAPLSTAQVRAMIGDGTPALVARGLAARAVPDTALEERLARFLAIYEADPVARTQLYPGVRRTLAAFAAEGRRLAICTNKPQRASLAVLRGLDIVDRFAAVLGGDAVPRKKPDPGHLLATLAALGAAPGEAVMIGDNEHDVAMARAAGVPVILAEYGYARVPVAALDADARIAAFAELPRAIRELDE
jgi:phosphoglycolate phosphatase